MNYMKQVAEMLGVELGERFWIGWTERRRDTEPRVIIDQSAFGGNTEYMLSDKGIQLCMTDESGNIVRTEHPDACLCGLLTGRYFIIKKTWKPKYEDVYWYIAKDKTTDAIYWRDSAVDIALYAMGNCFRTDAEAEAHREEMLQKMKEVLEE